MFTSARRFATRHACAAFALCAFGALASHSAFALTAADVAPLAADDFVAPE
ncbi:MAG: Urea ABC transporter, permease protein UrtB [uncultured Paraburkholderia sp.]|nr:MAG: Urea ABC transporter, permease protein UrtB [uncultured Paraburkholderia sp.]CAH2945136.1 MAG: Urea ABC transporter, permease protein UrtB [uncultured Paraburkholderia sp.]CAH2945291.1 MAG: Urea ABC transporter, permease protein UrtB [uncultured Paraburkholderia sp.]